MPPLPAIALTGATGFVGRHVLAHLAAAGHQVRVLVRRPGSLPPHSGPPAQEIIGDLDNPAALDQLLAGAHAVVHLVGIIMEHPSRGQTFQHIHVDGTVNLLTAARCASVTRWLHMSALGARPNAPSAYHRTKCAAEDAVRASSLAWTIFQPSLIHGPDGEFIQMVKQFCTGLLPPFLPYFGHGLLGLGGAGRLQPVWVDDVARCFTAALATPAAQLQTYALGGPDRYTWPALYRICRRHVPGARRKPIAPIPSWLALLLTRLHALPGVNADQVLMSREDNICDPAPAARDFNLAFARFEPTFASYATNIQ